MNPFGYRLKGEQTMTVQQVKAEAKKRFDKDLPDEEAQALL